MNCVVDAESIVDADDEQFIVMFTLQLERYLFMHCKCKSGFKVNARSTFNLANFTHGPSPEPKTGRDHHIPPTLH